MKIQEIIENDFSKNSINYVFNSDCVEIMRQFPDKFFDLAVVDPPYGINVNKMTLGNGNRKVFRGGNNWDESIPEEKYWTELFRISKNQVVWGANHMIQYLKPSSSWLFWDKGNGDNDFSDGELAWTSYGGALRKIKKTWIGANAKDGIERIHPTQKPVYLYEWIFEKYCQKGNLIFDSHLGSGSSRIAAEKYNLSFVGCEIDKTFFESQQKRFQEHSSQLRLF